MQEAGMKAASNAEPQVREQLNNQKGFLGELEKSIASLVDSLKGVIRDEPNPDGKADKVVPKLVPLDWIIYDPRQPIKFDNKR